MNKIFKYLLGCTAVFAVTAALVSCDDDDESDIVEAIYPTTVDLILPDDLESLSYTDDSGTKTVPMIAGETASFGYSITPDNVMFTDVIWSSSDESVATVDQDGNVTALSGSGNGYTVITVAPDPYYSGSGVLGSVKVVVSNSLVKATAIEITADQDYVYTGNTLQLSFDITPEDATYKTVTWTSSNSSLATVDDDGVVSGIAAGDVTITATAMDGSGVTATYDITVILTVDPEEVDIDQTYSVDNGYKFAVHDLTLTLDYTTVPEECTVSLIEWTSSDESIATVDGGVVTFSQEGNFGTVVITATCPSTGDSSSITLEAPAGLVRELFHNENFYTWKDAGQSGNDTSTSTEWHYGYITVTTYTQNATKQRGDLKCQNAITWLHSGYYPILAIRMDDVLDLYADEGAEARNITLDAVGTCDGTTYSGGLDGNNNKWLYDYVCSDGSHVFIYDLTKQSWATGGILPTTSPAGFTTFQFKYADIATITRQITYNVYWVQTFETLSDVATYLTSEGLTYEQN